MSWEKPGRLDHRGEHFSSLGRCDAVLDRRSVEYHLQNSDIWAMSFRLILTAILILPSIALAIEPDWNFVQKRLRQEGFKKDFVKMLKETYEPEGFNRVLELNVLLFLRKFDDHGVQVSRSAARTIKAFMGAHKKALEGARKDHGVEPSVIATLLWLESRHGENQGKFHVPSVYLHLLQAPRKEVVKYLKENTGQFTPHVGPKELQRIEDRTKTKSEWAIEELRALQKMYKADKQLVKHLRGSFAGAFGMPQFIPSSYTKWARTSRKNRAADLARAIDSIHSVAYYLKDNGWKRNKEKTYVKALLKYNNSLDYANAILKLAKQVDKTRMPALDRKEN